MLRGEAVSQAKSEILVDTVDDKFNELEREDKIERLLAELKSRREMSG